MYSKRFICSTCAPALRLGTERMRTFVFFAVVRDLFDHLKREGTRDVELVEQLAKEYHA